MAEVLSIYMDYPGRWTTPVKVHESANVETRVSSFKQALSVCPPDIEAKVRGLPLAMLERIEEIRFRLGQPLQVCGVDVDGFLHKKEGVTNNPDEAFIVTGDHISRVVQYVTRSSLYAVEDELRRGFVTMPGGHRVGVAGRVVVYESGYVRSIRSITSLNVRIARERIGAADKIAHALYRKTDGKPYSTLILSPPQCGKTTLLRDIARQWSANSIRKGGRPLKVTIVDERSEISGCVDGVPQFLVGPRTDVLDACPKAEGMLMAIRSLSPDVVVTDEIGREQDKDAILEAANTGVAVITSAHANTVAEWCQRPFMGELFSTHVFARYILLSRRLGPGTIESILDENGKIL
jgi:stage III sporulation protein AA